jgi:hypothetical protein
VPCAIEEYLSITKEKSNLEDILVENGAKEEMLRYVKKVLPQFHKPNPVIAIIFNQEKDVMEKEDLSIIIPTGEI